MDDEIDNLYREADQLEQTANNIVNEAPYKGEEARLAIINEANAQAEGLRNDAKDMRERADKMKEITNPDTEEGS